MILDADGQTITVTATDHGEHQMDVHGKNVRVWKLVAACRGIEIDWCNTLKGHWLRDYWRAKYPRSTIKYLEA